MATTGPEDLRKKASEADGRLAAYFGNTVPRPARDVTHELIHAVLSQNTHRRNYNLAYARLMDAFPTVEELAVAPLSKIEMTIRPGGLSRQKSKAIKSILLAIKEKTGSYSLDFIGDMDVPEAREYLTSLPGVGPKTASVVLMFALGRKVLPVDTHVLRTSKRIGLVDRRATAEKAQAALEELFPPPIRPRVHLNLVELGRKICHARGPTHEVCPVKSICDAYRTGLM